MAQTFREAMTEGAAVRLADRETSRRRHEIWVILPILSWIDRHNRQALQRQHGGGRD